MRNDTGIMLTTSAQENAELAVIGEWINTALADMPVFTPDERSLVVAGCLDVTLEVQAAICLLYRHGLYGSMMALMRTLNESLVRGLWIKACATDAQFAQFKVGRLDRNVTFGKMVADVEIALGGNPLLSRLKDAAWTWFNDFTHTGFQQVVRRHRPGELKMNYPEDELRRSQWIASALGLLAASSLAAMSTDETFGDKLLKRTGEFMARHKVT